MYIFGKLIPKREIGNAFLLIVSLAAFAWIAYDALDGTVELCNKYGGCVSASYSGPHDYPYFFALGIAMLLPGVLAVFSWQDLLRRTRDRHSSSKSGP